ncbi:MAG: GNAT family N-acetyltransferase [Bacteroidales bacterium]|nr:GNAT family N-acetyltransferase [Bacteroidales bacterium]
MHHRQGSICFESRCRSQGDIVFATFEINDLAVLPEHQGKGIASLLLDRLISDLKEQGIVGFHLITATEGYLPSFYEKHGFKKETRVMLMGT